jgi:hypothetical protein
MTAESPVITTCVQPGGTATQFMEIWFYGRGNRLRKADSCGCRRFLQVKSGQVNRTSFIKYVNNFHNISYLLLVVVVVLVVAATAAAVLVVLVGRSKVSNTSRSSSSSSSSSMPIYYPFTSQAHTPGQYF